MPKDESMTTTELKSCPLCGDDVYLDDSGIITSAGPDMMLCHKVNHDCILHELYGGREEIIVSQWNLRVPHA